MSFCHKPTKRQNIVIASVVWLPQFATTQPSVAKALEGILRPFRYTPLVFASKKIYGWHSLRSAIRSFSERWWAVRDSNT